MSSSSETSDDGDCSDIDIVVLKKKTDGSFLYIRRVGPRLMSRDGIKGTGHKVATKSQRLPSVSAAKRAVKSLVNSMSNKGYKQVKVDDSETRMKSGGRVKKKAKAQKKTKKKKKRKGDEGKRKTKRKKQTSSSDEDTGYVFDDSSEASDTVRSPCMYGGKCTRRNPNHFKQFLHPKGFKPARKKRKQTEDDDDDDASDSDSDYAPRAKRKKKSSVSKSGKSQAKGSKKPFAGMIIAFTGGMSVVRKEAQGLVAKFGGQSRVGVSKTCTHLVAANPDSGSSKLMKAEAMGIQLVDEEWFLDKVAEGRGA